MSTYYNEFDPFAAEWLRELIKDDLIADGVVDERSIEDVEPNDIREFTQCHFFAGIGGWSYAARLAGWSDDRPMWTGSPPCQPFSTAGNKKGKDDIRHLWPVFFNLIRECNPTVVFGEQVAPAIKDEWFDDLQNDMEAEGYATGMVVLPACSIGALHKRDRIFYVADRMANSNNTGQSSDTRRRKNNRHNKRNNSWWGGKALLCRDGKYRQIPTESTLFPLAHGIPNRVGTLRGAGNAIVPQVAAEVIKAYM